MLGLYLDDDGQGRWIDLPVRTLVHRHDPCGGLEAVKELLGVKPQRRMELTVFSAELVVAHQADIRAYPNKNPAAEMLGIPAIYGPLIAMGTPRTYDRDNPPTRIRDLQLRNAPATAGASVSNTPTTADRVRHVDTTVRQAVLSVRSLHDIREPRANSGSSLRSADQTPEDAFDEVMDVVADYVRTTGCSLTNANSVVTPSGGFLYSALAEFPADDLRSPTQSHTHRRNHGQ